MGAQVFELVLGDLAQPSARYPDHPSGEVAFCWEVGLRQLYAYPFVSSGDHQQPSSQPYHPLPSHRDASRENQNGEYRNHQKPTSS
jgi:hypothetical protein